MNSFFDKTKKLPDIGKIVRYVVMALAVILVVILISSCWYTVDEQEQAVITTFGQVTGTAEAGMHFKLPFGIQKVTPVPVNVFRKIEIGYKSEDNGDVSVDDESKMITGDYNIINIDFFVEYKISDPIKYLYNSYDADTILKNLVQSQLRSVVGSTDVDSALTTGRTEMQIQIQELVTTELEKYDIGLVLTNISIQDSEPPTETVTAAFKAVETAKQSAERVINQAEAYQNEKIPAAQAKADALLQNAEFLKQSRINEAKEAVAMFTAMYSQYQNDPEITRIRMYYEAISEVLPGVKLYIDTSESGVSKLLPLDSLVTDATSGTVDTSNTTTTKEDN